MLEMYEKCLIQGVLCGAETWHYNKRQFKIIEDIAPLEPESCKFKNATFQEKHFFNL